MHINALTVGVSVHNSNDVIPIAIRKFMYIFYSTKLNTSLLYEMNQMFFP